MTTDVFPSLKALGRPSSIIETIAEKNGGIILIGGGHYSGRTTTIVSLAHELKEQGRNVIQVRLPNVETLPGLDSISSDSVDEAMLSYLSHEGRPDVLVLNDVEDPELYRLAFVIAEKGSLVIAGMYAKSAEASIFNFLEGLPEHHGLSGAYRSLIFLSVHHRNIPLSGGCSLTQEDISQLEAVNDARKIFIAEDSKRYYLSRSRGRTVLHYQMVIR